MRVPEFWHAEAHVDIQCYGKALRYDPAHDDTEEACAVIAAFADRIRPAQDILWQRFSTNRDLPERFIAAERSELPRSPQPGQVCMHTAKRYNGIILREPGTVALATRDCPIVVLWSRKQASGSPVGIFHFSRESAQGVDVETPTASALIHGATECLRSWRDSKHVRGIITFGIGATHFTNERHPEITEALRKHWGNEVVPDGAQHTIDLVALARAQLASFGIDPSQIMHDGFDTFSDERLASNRRGHKGYHNLVLVTYRKTNH